MYTLLSDFYVNFIVTGLLFIGNIPLKRSIIFYSRIFSAYSLSNFDSIHGSTCDSACVTGTFSTWINSCHICCELLITYDSYRRRSTAFNTTEQCILSVKSGNSFSEGSDTFFNRIAYCFWQNRAYICQYIFSLHTGSNLS